MARTVLWPAWTGTRPEGDPNAVQLHLVPIVQFVQQLLLGEQPVTEQQQRQQQDFAQSHQACRQQRLQKQGAASAKLFQGQAPLALVASRLAGAHLVKALKTDLLVQA